MEDEMLPRTERKQKKYLAKLSRVIIMPLRFFPLMFCSRWKYETESKKGGKKETYFVRKNSIFSAGDETN